MRHLARLDAIAPAPARRQAAGAGLPEVPQKRSVRMTNREVKAADASDIFE